MALALRVSFDVKRGIYSMCQRLPRLIAILLVCIAPGATAQAQPSDAAAVVARVREARVAQAQQSLAASVRSTAVITVVDANSRIDLVEPQTIIHEAQGVYHRDPLLGSRLRIVATRGTAPISGISRGPIENYRSLGETVALDDDRIILLNTIFVSPLAADADRYYAFEHAGVEQRSGQEVDVVRVVPTSKLRPLFDGRLYVSRASAGSLIAMELQPSATTTIPFITALQLAQTFTLNGDGVMVPDSLFVGGVGMVRFAVLGLAETRVDFAISTALDDQRLGAPMPDSLRTQYDQITVRRDASEAPDAVWSTGSLLTSEQISTSESSRAAYVDASRSLSASFGAMLDYNRAGSVTPTVSAGAAFGAIGAGLSGGYSFGIERPVGEGAITLKLVDAWPLTATIRGGAFSLISPTTTGDRSYPRIMNSLVAATLHQDYYDFFRKDGWSAGGEIGYGKLRLGATYEQSRQFSIGNNARWALLTWTSKDFPENPPITEGAYQTVQGDLAFSHVAPFLKLTPLGDEDLRFSVSGLLGERIGTDTTFRLAEGLVSWSIPIVETGYNPIALTLLAAGGIGTATLPPQYQFRLRTSAASFGKPGGLVSPPKGLYGGTEYIALGVEVNLTDLPWRALGLPTIAGRGIELLVAAAAARYRQAHHYGYEGTGDEWYPEVGLALSRIPLFLTEIVYGRVDVRQGLGPLGRTGANFTFVLPL